MAQEKVAKKQRKKFIKRENLNQIKFDYIVIKIANEKIREEAIEYLLT